MTEIEKIIAGITKKNPEGDSLCFSAVNYR